MCAMPTASDGAPPVRREERRLAHAAARARCICAGVDRKPQAVIVAVAVAGSGADDARRAVDREVDAGIQRGRRRSAP